MIVVNDFEKHNIQIQENRCFWEQKLVLQAIYNDFYKLIISNINDSLGGKIVEIGSGIGNLKKHIPACICTDAFPNPWIDQVENAYKLSFADEEVSNLILFDVWHHLEYPVLALREFERVLQKQGHIILFEPCISLLGWIVYGLFHPEKVNWFKKIDRSTNAVDVNNLTYYAAQGNASRFFFKKEYKACYEGFSITHIEKKAALAYVLSGGYSKKQLFPDKFYPKIKRMERLCKKMPSLFATRLLVVLKKK